MAGETTQGDMIVGAFYWVMPANDPDLKDAWEEYSQPARFWGRSSNGSLLWQCIGAERSVWPMRWIGPRILSPFGDEVERVALENKRTDFGARD